MPHITGGKPSARFRSSYEHLLCMEIRIPTRLGDGFIVGDFLSFLEICFFSKQKETICIHLCTDPKS